MELRIHSAKSNGQNNNSRPQIFSPTSSVMDQKGGYSIVANPLPQFEEEKKPGIIGIKGAQANHDIDMRKKSTKSFKSPPDTIAGSGENENNQGKTQNGDKPDELQLEEIEDLGNEEDDEENNLMGSQK